MALLAPVGASFWAAFRLKPGFYPGYKMSGSSVVVDFQIIFVSEFSAKIEENAL